MIRKIYLISTYSFMAISALFALYLVLPAEIQEQVPLITKFMAITGSVSFGTFTGVLMWVHNMIGKLNKANLEQHANNDNKIKLLEDENKIQSEKLDNVIKLLTLLVESKADNPFTKSDIKNKIKDVLSDE